MEAVQGVRGHRTLLSVAPQAGVRVTCPMKRSGSDYWKLYHDDFFDDERVLPLSAAEVGIYLWLLGLQAKHGSLPGSDAALAAMGRRWGRDWGKAWPKLAKFFPINDSGNRENHRQAFELSEVDASRSKETSRKTRWRDRKRALSTGTSAGQGRGQDGDGDALSRLRGEEIREEETRSSPPSPPPGAGSQVAPLTEPKKRKPANPRIDPATYPLPPSLDFPDVRAALVDYLETRKGGAWDEKLAAVRVRQLDEWGRERAIAALQHSVGYQGVFEPSGVRANGKPYQHAFEKTGDAIDQVFGKRSERQRTIDIQTVKPKEIES